MAGITRKTIRNEEMQRWVQVTRNGDLREWTLAIGELDKLVAYDSVTFKFGPKMFSWDCAISHAVWMTKFHR